MGARRAKPRRTRLKYKDPATGKMVAYYPDTLRPHADPACECDKCKALAGILRTKKATENKKK